MLINREIISNITNVILKKISVSDVSAYAIIDITNNMNPPNITNKLANNELTIPNPPQSITFVLFRLFNQIRKFIISSFIIYKSQLIQHKLDIGKFLYNILRYKLGITPLTIFEKFLH